MEGGRDEVGGGQREQRRGEIGGERGGRRKGEEGGLTCRTPGISMRETRSAQAELDSRLTTEGSS